MRAVAARLGAVPMALYNHFATKEQLVDALLDRVLGRFEPAPPSDDWIEDLRAFARAHRRLLAAHAWAVAPLFTSPTRGSARSGSASTRSAILDRGGLSDDRAVAAFSGLIALNYGWASFTAARDLDPRRAEPRRHRDARAAPARDVPAHGRRGRRDGRLRQRRALRARARARCSAGCGGEAARQAISGRRPRAVRARNA